MKTYASLRLSHLMPAQDELGSPPKCFAVPKIMARRPRIENISTPGMFYDFYTAKQLVEDMCSCVWVDAITIRRATDEEHQAAKKVREGKLELFPRLEVLGVRYKRPKGNKYRIPIEEYDALELPLVGHTCRWRPQMASM